MKRSNRNKAASVRERLLILSRKSGEDFQFVLQRYGAERFLYRLGESRYRDRYVLKGAMLFALWGGSIYRPTRDLDFTGYGSSDISEVLTSFREICQLPVEDDGLMFNISTLAAEPIRDDSEYDGLRVKFIASIGETRIPMQIDVGFGNAIEPPAADAEYPTLLDGPAPHIRAYPHEAVIAEKLHTVIRFGERNSRLKDFYDLYVIAKEFSFDSRLLAGAIAATFKRRQTTIDVAQPVALTPRFFADKARAAQWRTYLNRNRLPGAPPDFDAVGEMLRAFLGPTWEALAERTVFGSTWQTGGPWGVKETKPSPEVSISVKPAVKVPVYRAPLTHSADIRSARNNPESYELRRFKPYIGYKDSDVEWLGEIPAHWEVRRLKFVSTIIMGQSPPSEQYNTVGDGFPFLQGNADFGMEHPEPRIFCPVAPKTVKPGDHLISVRAPVGALNIADQEYGIGRGLCAVRIRPPLVDNHFARWSLSISSRGFDAVATGSTYEAVSAEDISGMLIPLPQAEEQRAISTFLDLETAKIDALVAKKERLIELLQEKRIALITQSVTKGLDPIVPMKDSGVEWLGEIPGHWEVKRLKFLVTESLTYGANEIAELSDPDSPRYIRITDIRDDGTLREDTFRSIPMEIAIPYLLDEGDLLFARSGATVGKTFRYDPSWGVAAYAGYLIRACLDKRKTDSKFLLYFTQSNGYWDWLRTSTIQATIQNVSAERYANLVTPLPPLPEQHAIVAFLDRETAKIDALVSKIREAIDRLKELRTALISAAVTGKIDVREKVA